MQQTLFHIPKKNNRKERKKRMVTIIITNDKFSNKLRTVSFGNHNFYGPNLSVCTMEDRIHEIPVRERRTGDLIATLKIRQNEMVGRGH
jgi:hypothetical protein